MSLHFSDMFVDSKIHPCPVGQGVCNTLYIFDVDEVNNTVTRSTQMQIEFPGHCIVVQNSIAL